MGAKSWSDMGTKHVGQARMQECLTALGFRFMEGSSAIALEAAMASTARLRHLARRRCLSERGFSVGVEPRDRSGLSQRAVDASVKLT